MKVKSNLRAGEWVHIVGQKGRWWRPNQKK